MHQLPPPVPTMWGLSFPVLVDGKVVAMGISQEALQDHFDAEGGATSWINSYEQNSSVIDEKALERYLAEPHVKVLLKTADF